MKLTPVQLVLVAEALLASVLAAGVGLGVAVTHGALTSASVPGWAAALVWALPAGALAHAARRAHVVAEARRWHGAALRRVEALVEDDDEDAEDEDDAGRVDDEVVDESRG